MIEGENIICFAEFWDWGNPLGKVHIMKRLAKANRILFVESIGFRRPQATRTDIGKILSRVTAWLSGCKEVEPNIHVFAPIAVPIHESAAIRRLNGILLGHQLKFYLRRLGMDQPLLWICSPTFEGVIGHLDEKLVILHVFDNWPAFEDVSSETITELQCRAALSSDLIITVGRQMYHEYRQLNPNTFLIDHGVDFEHFAGDWVASATCPTDLIRIRKPIIGYFGILNKYWVDFDLLYSVAASRADWSFVMIGPIHVVAGTPFRKLQRLENVHFLGKKDYSELPMYAHHFDVCIIPFRVCELTQAAKPLKLKEYLAAGKPVVSTVVPEDDRVLNLVTTAQTPDDFQRAIEHHLLNDNSTQMRERQQAVRTESWAGKVEEISLLIENALLNAGDRGYGRCDGETCASSS